MSDDGYAPTSTNDEPSRAEKLLGDIAELVGIALLMGVAVTGCWILSIVLSLTLWVAQGVLVPDAFATLLLLSIPFVMAIALRAFLPVPTDVNLTAIAGGIALGFVVGQAIMSRTGE